MIFLFYPKDKSLHLNQMPNTVFSKNVLSTEIWAKHVDFSFEHPFNSIPTSGDFS